MIMLSAFRQIFGLFLCLALSVPAAQATASLLISPINPAIEAGRKAGAIWVENRGNSPVLLQARVFAWQQEDGNDRYSSQDSIVVSPPIVEIAARSRQIVRFVRASVAQPAGEAAYRILLDEVPTQKPASQRSERALASPGVQFRLRYSLPLFVYGNQNSASLQPQLQCAIIGKAGKHLLEIYNTGSMHARLVDAAFVQDSRRTPVGKALLGYALSGSMLRVPLADGMAAGSLSVKVNDATQPLTLPACTMQ